MTDEPQRQRTDEDRREAAKDMDCREAVEQLYEFLDGVLDDERRVVIRHHLDECGSCLGAFGFETELRRVIATRCVERVPDDLRARIAAQIEHPS